MEESRNALMEEDSFGKEPYISLILGYIYSSKFII